MGALVDCAQTAQYKPPHFNLKGKTTNKQMK